MIKQIIEQLNIPGELIYLTQFGSHLYGTNTENSDLDYRGIFIPKIRDIVLKRDVDEYNTVLNINNIKVDVKLFSIHKFIRLCSKADTNALDLLFSYNPERKDIQQYDYNKEQYYENGILAHPYIPFIEFLINRGKLINTDRLESPITYAFKQATKYSINPKVPKELIKLEQFLEKHK